MTTNRPRFVVDTNLVISAAQQVNSLSFQVLESIIWHGVILQSTSTISELVDVFQRPKFDRYTTLATRFRFLGELSFHMTLVRVTTSVSACRDPKDNKFLELAISGAAGAVVTGDRALLDLHPFQNIPILSPRDFFGFSPMK